MEEQGEKKAIDVGVGMFLKGLVSAVIGGVATSVAQSQSGVSADFDHMSKAAVAGALLGGCSYLVGHVHGQDKANEVNEAESTARTKDQGAA